MANEKVVYRQIGDKTHEITLKKLKNSKNIRLKINSSLKITITMPKYSTYKIAEKFLDTKLMWMENTLAKMTAKQQIQQKNYHQNLRKLSKEEFLEKSRYLILRCQELGKKFGFKYQNIKIKNQKTLWGSCSRHNNINLNMNLVFLPDELVDYVILHELVHTEIKNHSKKFWQRLEEVLPGAANLNKELKGFRLNSFELQKLIY